jgi:type VI protein secretion system component Hcp
MGAYLMLGGTKDKPEVEGSVTEGEHIKWIPISSFSFNAARGIVSIGGSHQTTHMAHADVSDISFSKPMDASSVGILQKLLSGLMFDNLQMDLTSTDNGQKRTYFSMKGKYCRITSVSANGSGQEGSVATESFSVNVRSVSWAFYPLDAESKPGTPVVAGWNLDTVVTEAKELFESK